MNKRRHSEPFRLFFLTVILALNFLPACGQDRQRIYGKIIADSINNTTVNVVNITAKRGVISRPGGQFNLWVKKGDTLLFTGVKYRHKRVIITDSVLQKEKWTVYLKNALYVLPEVSVSSLGLTGNLREDEKKLKPFNQAKEGFPHTAKPITPAERRLYTASTGGGLIPLDPIINMITGRMAMIKKQVANEHLEADKKRVFKIVPRWFFLDELKIDKDRLYLFIHYCLDFKEFKEKLHAKNTLVLMDYLRKKAIDFKKRVSKEK